MTNRDKPKANSGILYVGAPQDLKKWLPWLRSFYAQKGMDFKTLSVYPKRKRIKRIGWGSQYAADVIHWGEPDKEGLVDVDTREPWSV